MLEFNEETHTYKLDGKVIPSVTQIIDELLPTNYKPNDWYLQRGKAVHACAAMIARGVDFVSDSRIDGQVRAIEKFFKEVKPEVFGVEIKLVSKSYRYGGTYDLAARIDGKYVLVDYKGTVEIERTGLQLAAYSRLCIPLIVYGIGVEIREDGTYKMTEPIKLKNYYREFLALRATYGIRERLGLNKRRVE